MDIFVYEWMVDGFSWPSVSLSLALTPTSSLPSPTDADRHPLLHEPLCDPYLTPRDTCCLCSPFPPVCSPRLFHPTDADRYALLHEPRDLEPQALQLRHGHLVPRLPHLRALRPQAPFPRQQVRIYTIFRPSRTCIQA